MVLLGVLLAAVVFLYISKWLSIEVTSMLIPPALVLCGLLEVDQALSGFSNPATITIASLLIISAGLTRTGSLDLLTEFLRRRAGGSQARLLLVLALTVPVISAMMNNIPVVAMLVPVVLTLSREMDVKPSKLMIPLSYFAILGGTCTLIGTSTNVVVHEQFRRWQIGQGLKGEGFSMFEFLPMGLILLAGGTLFLVAVGSRLLPDRTSLAALMPRQRTAKFVTEAMVEEGSSLLGRKVEEVFPKGEDVKLLEVIRGEDVILGAEMRELELADGDSLIIEGTSSRITEFLAESRASLASVLEDDRRVPMSTIELMLGEAVILPDSPFVGRTIAGLALNRQFGIKVLAVQRGGRHHRRNIKTVRLKAGDVLLLQASARGFDALRESESVLIVEGLEGAIKHRRQTPFALVILFAVVGLAALSPLPLEILAGAGAALMVATRCLRTDEAMRSLDPAVLLLLAGTIPLGLAMQESGLAAAAVGGSLGLLEGTSPRVILGAFYLVTVLITNFLSNQATAILLVPIGIEMALQLGVDPRPFLMTICFAASASFATPIGYPTNLIVLGPGGYHFSDFLKIGLSMNLLAWILATTFIPIFWPF